MGDNKMKKIIMILVLGSLCFGLLGAGRIGVDTASASPDGGWCNGSGVLTVLVLGTDNRTRSYTYGLADSIMIFRIDFEAPAVTVMSLPRDLWVKVPGIRDELGVDHVKLNMAYLYGTDEMAFNPEVEDGAGLVALALEENWGLKIDRTAVMNMKVFADVVRAIGGIEVYNPAPVYSFHQEKPKYPTGGYFFDGKDAQLYARWRDPRNMLDRVDRHSILVEAIIESLFQPETVPQIPELISAYHANVEMNLSLAQISQLLCLASKRDHVEVSFTRIPEEDLLARRTKFPPLNANIYNLVEKEPGRIETILQEFQAGNWPPD
jgi:LCP family protein required for cell wall assembly